MAKKQAQPTKAVSSKIEHTIKALQTKFGEGAIMKLGEKPRVNVAFFFVSQVN